MNADIYNNTRRILFSTANDPEKGFTKAYDWMERTYRKKLGKSGYIGLMAELKFYEKYKSEFKLTIAGDMGEHADFSGFYDSKITRFDVTTNVNYKKFEDYEPYMDDGSIYRIAIVDPSNYEISDVVSLSFERCDCNGYMIPFILLKDQNYNSSGAAMWSNDQYQMKVCSKCNKFIRTKKHTHQFLYSPSEYYKNLPEEMPDKEKRKELLNYSLNAYKYFRREYNDELMGVAEHSYKITKPDGDGFWTFYFHFKNNVIANKISDDIDCGLIS